MMVGALKGPESSTQRGFPPDALGGAYDRMLAFERVVIDTVQDNCVSRVIVPTFP